MSDTYKHHTINKLIFQSLTYSKLTQQSLHPSNTFYMNPSPATAATCTILHTPCSGECARIQKFHTHYRSDVDRCAVLTVRGHIELITTLFGETHWAGSARNITLAFSNWRIGTWRRLSSGCLCTQRCFRWEKWFWIYRSWFRKSACLPRVFPLDFIFLLLLVLGEEVVSRRGE